MIAKTKRAVNWTTAASTTAVESLLSSHYFNLNFANQSLVHIHIAIDSYLRQLLLPFIQLS